VNGLKDIVNKKIMKLEIKQYKFQKVEVGSKEIDLPSETSYQI
jgi:hypothetical protein